MPSVRALARELGVDLRGLRGTGPGGRIIKQDVEDTAQALAYGAAVPLPRPPVPRGPSLRPRHAAAPSRLRRRRPWSGRRGREAELAPVLGGVIEHDGHGPVERVLFRGVRRSMARRMAEAVAKQAQVTTMDEADVTIIKRIREKERTVAAERGVRLTYLAFVVKACTASLKRFPRLNAVLDESGEEFLLKRYYNIGIAIDTTQRADGAEHQGCRPQEHLPDRRGDRRPGRPGGGTEDRPAGVPGRHLQHHATTVPSAAFSPPRSSTTRRWRSWGWAG